LTDWSLSPERILVANKPAAEKARSASIEVGGMLSYDLLPQLCLLWLQHTCRRLDIWDL